MAGFLCCTCVQSDHEERDGKDDDRYAPHEFGSHAGDMHCNVDVEFTLGVSMKRALFFLLTFCMLVFMASFFVAVSKESTAAYSLSVVSFSCFVALYSAGVLGYKVGGSTLSLEDKVNTLEKENTELKESVTALAKSIYMVSSENAPAFGFNHSPDGLLDKYLAPVNHLIEGDIKASVEEDLKKLTYPQNP